MPNQLPSDHWLPCEVISFNSSTSVPVGPPAGRPGRAWVQLVGSVLALGALACALPSPGSAASLLSTSGSARTTTAVADTAMLLAASGAVWLLLLWALLVAGSALTGRLPGGAGRYGRNVFRRVAPVAARRVLLTVVGASMVTGLAACGTDPTAAAIRSSAQPRAAADGLNSDQRIAADPVALHQAGSWIAVEGSAVHLRPTAAADSSGWFAAIGIDWPVGRSAPTTPATPVDIDWPTNPTRAAEPVVVLRGDSLWSIAASHLPPNAGPDDIDRAWRRWYAANAAVIGGNPGLILPGQILLPPNTGTDN